MCFVATQNVKNHKKYLPEVVKQGYFERNKGEEFLMNTVPAEIVRTTAVEIPFQPASMDIWEKKYRLIKKDGTAIDKTMDDT